MGGRTLTSQPKFLGSIGYQIRLAMVVRYENKLKLTVAKHKGLQRPKHIKAPLNKTRLV